MRNMLWIMIGVMLLGVLSGCSPSGNRQSPPAGSGNGGQTAQPQQSPSSGNTTPPASNGIANKPPAAEPAPATNGPLAPAEAKKIIAARANEVVTALKNKDFAKLKAYVHPQKGVRISPYSYVNVKTDIVFSAEQVETLMKDAKKITWGAYAGSGEPIALTFSDYYGKFLYDHDYAKPEKIGYNEILGKGNMKNNIADVYPNDIVVEHHFSGFDKQFQGQDWASLRLIFEKAGSDWMLVGITHDQWTP